MQIILSGLQSNLANTVRGMKYKRVATLLLVCLYTFSFGFLCVNTVHAALPNAFPATSGLHLTSFEIDGDLDNDATFTGSASGVSGDWEDSLESDLPGTGFYSNGPTPADGAAGLNADTTGIYYSKRNVDKASCNGDTDDDIIPSDPGSNVKVDDGPNWPTTIGNVPAKDDLEDVWVALETVRLQTATTDQVHHIAYIAFERCSGTGGAMSAILFFENGDGVLPSDGPGTVGDPSFPFTDLLFEFHVSGTGSPSNDITQYERNATNDGWINPQAVSSVFWDVASNGNNPTFGEIAIDLTGAGIIPDDQCVNLQITGSAATIAGGSIASDPKDVVVIEPVTVQNCAPLQVNKVSNPAGLNVAEEFTYVVDQLDGAATHSLLQNNATVDLAVTGNSIAATEPDADQSEIDQVITIGEIHNWVNVIAEPDYQIDETLLPVSGDWALDNIVCTWYDPFAGTTFTDEEVHDGTSITRQFVIPSPGFSNGVLTTCTISNITDALDYGDATDTYHGGVLADAPSHFINADLKLGTATTDKDDPTAIVFAQSADADDTDADGDDEDGLQPLQKYMPLGGLTCTGTNGSYTTLANEYCAVVSVTNGTAQDAQLVGWLDYDVDGVFSEAERSQTAPGAVHPDDDGTFTTGNVPAMSGTNNYVLVWTGLGDIDSQSAFQTNLRLRVTGALNSGFFSDASPQPISGAGDGEVEDHLVAFDTLPVTISSVATKKIANKVKFDWSTSSELFNVGFQLWGLDGKDSKWEKLHGWLVRSGSGNAVEQQSYTKTVNVPNSVSELVALGISSVDSDGSEHYYGPFEVGMAYGDLTNLKPIAWNHIRAEADRQMAARGYIKDRIHGYRKVADTDTKDALTLSSIDTESIVELTLSESGLYRISAQALLSAGVDWSETVKRDIAIIDHHGRAVVRYVHARGSGSGQSRALGTGGEIYFYAPPMDSVAGLYSRSNVYRLVLDRYRALNAQNQRKQGLSSGFSEHYLETVRIEKDTHYSLASRADDPWLDATVLSYEDLERSYAAGIPVEPDAIWSQPSRVKLGLASSSQLNPVDNDGDGQQDAEHIVVGVIASSSGTGGLLSLGTSQAVGAGQWSAEFEVPANTPVSLYGNQAVVGGMFKAGKDYAFSEVHVDSVSFSYARPYVAKAGDAHLSFTAPNNGESGYEVTIPDTGWPWAFAYNDQGALVRLSLESQTRVTGSDGSNQRMVRIAALDGTASANGATNYWVSGRHGFLSAESLTARSIVSKSALLSQALGSDYLIIAHPAFMGTDSSGIDHLSRYANVKQGQGYRVSVIDYLEIVDAFGGGQAGPHGLTNYLADVAVQGDIEHVLFVGSSSYDHNDYLGTGSITFIPGHYGESDNSKFTVSDTPYIMGVDGNLFATVGRWPVRTKADLQTIVSKSIAWSSAGHQNSEALLIAENEIAGEDVNFAAALDSLSQTLPVSMDQVRVYVDEIRSSDPTLTIPGALNLAKQQILSELNQFPELVIYNGHATTRQLSNTGLLKSSDLGQVNQNGAEIWLPLSCYLTYYESTHVNTLAHQLLFRANAVNISGATLLSSQQSNIAAGNAILKNTLIENQTIGEALNTHKQGQNQGFKINWALLGDPTLMIGPR